MRTDNSINSSMIIKVKRGVLYHGNFATATGEEGSIASDLSLRASQTCARVSTGAEGGLIGKVTAVLNRMLAVERKRMSFNGRDVEDGRRCRDLRVCDAVI